MRSTVKSRFQQKQSNKEELNFLNADESLTVQVKVKKIKKNFQ